MTTLLLKPLIFLQDSCLSLLKFHGAAAPEKLEASINVVRMSIDTTWTRQLRSLLLVPIFKSLVALCLIISLLVFVEGIYMNLVVLYVKLFKRKPEKVYKWVPMPEDIELRHETYPMVLVQIPMYNEKEVLQLSIGAACRLIWPVDRLIVQVLDDSTDQTIKELVNTECAKWDSKGINIKCERRDNGTYRPSFSTSATWDQIRQVGLETNWSKGVWFAGATPKYSFLLWLAALNRLSTGDRMLGWNQGINPICVLCRQTTETRDHLFFRCHFSGSVWSGLVRALLNTRYSATFSEILTLISDSSCAQSLRFVLRYVFQATVYTVWQERNNRRHGEVPLSSAYLSSTIDRLVRNRIVSFHRLYPAKHPDAYGIWVGSHP